MRPRANPMNRRIVKKSPMFSNRRLNIKNPILSKPVKRRVKKVLFKDVFSRNLEEDETIDMDEVNRVLKEDNIRDKSYPEQTEVEVYGTDISRTKIKNVLEKHNVEDMDDSEMTEVVPDGKKRKKRTTDYVDLTSEDEDVDMSNINMGKSESLDKNNDGYIDLEDIKYSRRVKTYGEDQKPTQKKKIGGVIDTVFGAGEEGATRRYLDKRDRDVIEKVKRQGLMPTLTEGVGNVARAYDKQKNYLREKELKALEFKRRKEEAKANLQYQKLRSKTITGKIGSPAPRENMGVTPPRRRLNPLSSFSNPLAPKPKMVLPTQPQEQQQMTTASEEKMMKPKRKYIKSGKYSMDNPDYKPPRYRWVVAEDPVSGKVVKLKIQRRAPKKKKKDLYSL